MSQPNFLQVAASVRSFFLGLCFFRQLYSLLTLTFFRLVVYHIEHVSHKVCKSAHRRLHLSGDKTSLWVDYLSVFIYLMFFLYQMRGASDVGVRGVGRRDFGED